MKPRSYVFLTMSLLMASPVLACPKAVLGERPAEEMECKSKSASRWDSEDAELLTVTDLKIGKKKAQTYLVKGDLARVLKVDAAVGADSAAKAFAKAFPLAVDKNVLRKLLKYEFKTVGEDVCLSFIGPVDVVAGEVQICNASPQKVQTPVAPVLVPGATTLAKAKQLTLKEFQRLEKEEEAPSATEIFGDPDTFSRMIVGPDLSSSMYYFWTNLFSKSGVALIAVGLDGKVKSEAIDGSPEFSAPAAEARIKKWK